MSENFNIWFWSIDCLLSFMLLSSQFLVWCMTFTCILAFWDIIVWDLILHNHLFSRYLPVEVQHRGATSSWVYVFIFPLSPANASLQKWSTLTHLPPCGDVGEHLAFLLLLTTPGWNVVWHSSTLPPSWGGGVSAQPLLSWGREAEGWLTLLGCQSPGVSHFMWPQELQLTRLLCPRDSPGTNTRVGCHSLLQGIFLTQGSNPGLLLWRQVLYCLSHQESDREFILKRLLWGKLVSTCVSGKRWRVSSPLSPMTGGLSPAPWCRE